MTEARKSFLDGAIKALLTAIITALLTAYITTIRLEERVASLTFRLEQCEANVAGHIARDNEIYQRIAICEARIGYIGPHEPHKEH